MFFSLKLKNKIEYNLYDKNIIKQNKNILISYKYNGINDFKYNIIKHK